MSYFSGFAGGWLDGKKQMSIALRQFPLPPRTLGLVMMALLVALLGACGGGGSGDYEPVTEPVNETIRFSAQYANADQSARVLASFSSGDANVPTGVYRIQVAQELSEFSQALKYDLSSLVSYDFDGKDYFLIIHVAPCASLLRREGFVSGNLFIYEAEYKFSVDLVCPAVITPEVFLFEVDKPPAPPQAISPNALPQTGQALCYETVTRLVASCEGSGQDGEVRAGAPWPSPRFVARSLEFTRDDLTGLEWTRDRDAPGPAACTPGVQKSWQDGLDYIKCLNENAYLGFSDWRMPNAVELSSLLNARYDQSFFENFDHSSWGYWWTSTTHASSLMRAVTSLAEEGYISSALKTDTFKVWPVRSGAAGVVSLHRTGQSGCYDTDGSSIDCSGTGQDGETLMGRPWPSPRFVENGDGTITDNLTGIAWTKNADYPFSEMCSQGTSDFGDTVNYIKCLNQNKYLGYDNWRLPNEFEINSLRNYGIPTSDKPAWLSGYGFNNLSPWGLHWSSTVEDTNGFAVGVWVGGGHWDFEYQSGHAWPVRGGIYPR